MSPLGTIRKLIMTKIYYHATGTDWRKEQKYRFLDESGSVSGVDWTEITPDAKHNWLTEGMRDEFGTFLKLVGGPDDSDESIFNLSGYGVQTIAINGSLILIGIH